VAGSGGSHATKVQLGVIECLEGGGDMAKNFEKNSAKKERKVGVSKLINFLVRNFVLLRTLKMSWDTLKGGFFFSWNIFKKSPKTRGVSTTLCGLAISIKKGILRQKRRRIMETNSNIISPCQNYNLPKNPLKEINILQNIIITLL
jgi:hypothetical protein